MQNITGSARSHGWVRMAILTLDTCMFGYRNPQDSQAYRRPASPGALPPPPLALLPRPQAPPQQSSSVLFTENAYAAQYSTYYPAMHMHGSTCIKPSVATPIAVRVAASAGVCAPPTARSPAGACMSSCDLDSATCQATSPSSAPVRDSRVVRSRGRVSAAP